MIDSLQAEDSSATNRDSRRINTYYAIFPLISRADPSNPALRNTGSGRGGSRSLPLRQVACTTWRQRYKITSESGVSWIDREHTEHVVFAVGRVGQKERSELGVNERRYGEVVPTCEKESAGLAILQLARELCTVSVEYRLAPLQ